VLIALGLAAAFVWAVTTAMASQLHASDAAGNGLAQAFYVGGLALQWLLVAIAVVGSLWIPATEPMPGATRHLVPVALSAAFAAPLLAHAFALPWLFDADNRGVRRTIVLVASALPPLALLAFVAWRGGFLPVLDVVAAFAGPAIAVAASLTTIGVSVSSRRSRRRRSAVTVTTLAHPLLLLHDGISIAASHHAEATLCLVVADRDRDGLLVVDATGTEWHVRAIENGAPVFARRTVPLGFAAMRAAILRLPPFDANTAEDAEIRRLVAMQKDVASLAFVLPR